MGMTVMSDVNDLFQTATVMTSPSNRGADRLDRIGGDHPCPLGRPPPPCPCLLAYEVTYSWPDSSRSSNMISSVIGRSTVGSSARSAKRSKVKGFGTGS